MWEGDATDVAGFEAVAVGVEGREGEFSTGGHRIESPMRRGCTRASTGRSAPPRRLAGLTRAQHWR